MILPDLIELTGKIKEIDQHITIETAGTKYQKVDCDLMSISPKLSNSTPYDREGGKFAEQHEELAVLGRVAVVAKVGRIR